jgi:membrane associated rhomboid family serine protease
MLPLRDINPTRRAPILTWILIAINVLVFLWEISMPQEELQRVFRDYGVVPNNVSGNPISLESFLDTVRSMFFHGGWAHLGGNMLYLYLFGDNIEDRFGRVLYLFLYLVSGFAATVAQILIDPESMIPLVGASGAIAGVLGSYLVLFPGVRVQGIVPLGFWAFFTQLPAWMVLIFWFVIQVFSGLAALGPSTMATEGGVAFFAHIGGFVAGMLITAVFSVIVPQPERPQRYEMLYERAKRYRY